ncbi:5-formyltetrahydrofolate cyclo-ligase [Massilia glaciei]|uniref:5-formyltetrahydrofolate cyclo-ligase n=1 Tax=Massilia glaciei TaxID=1524097 RepID=UPI001E49C227|nr:5-formyltetrahydrofolate cyclo-ligase [Massilia glaciei]
MPAPLPAPAHANDKSALRRQLLAARRAIDPARKIMWDREIGARLLAWSRARAVPELAVYWPLAGEPDLSEAYAELARRGVRLALPVVTARAAPLAFALWEPGEAMQTDQMGVAVPAALRPLARPGAIALPCVGFNAQRFRLGYGGGYYDRTLEAAPRPFAIGIAYAQLEAGFDGAAHDIALDLIITEAGPQCI